jgi:5'-nucleotidase/UDP-sugar diphosphatase
MRIMKQPTALRFRAARALATAIAVAGLFLATAPLAAQTAQITLLHVNDTHSHLAAWGPKDGSLDGTLGGLPKAAAIVAAERSLDPNALFVHSGDFMEGDIFFNEYLGVPELQLLQSIGLDALVLGNHEFRFGPDFLAGVFQSAWSVPAGGVPVLGANLEIAAGSLLEPWIGSSLVKEVNGVKVGIFGLTVFDGAMCNPAPVNILPDYVVIAQEQVDALRAGGVQIVVGLTHFGMENARLLAENVSGIDVIINGHDNAELEQPEPIARPGGGTTFIVSAGHHYRWVGRLRLSYGGGEVGLVDYALIGADADTPSAPTVQAAVDTLKAGIVALYGDMYHQPLALALRDITMDWDLDKAKRDTPLGNLITDAYRAWTGTDMAMEPFGFMGDPLAEGPVVGADVFRAMSYGNYKTSPRTFVRPWRLETYQMTGANMLMALEILLHYGGDYFPQVSGLRFQYDSTAGFGRKILLDTVEVGGLPIDTGALYSFTATEQVYGALASLLHIPTENPIVLTAYAFDAVRSFVNSRHQLVFTTSGRIRDIAALPRGKKDKSEAQPLRLHEIR